MIQIENKLELFENVVYKSRLKEKERVLEKWQEEKEKAKQEKMEQLDGEEREMIERRRQIAKTMGNERLAKVREEIRVSSLQQNTLLKEEFTEGIRERVRQYTKEDRYKIYLLESLATTLEKLDPGTYLLGLTASDNLRFNEEIEAMGPKYHHKLVRMSMPDEVLGGFIISDEKNTYNLSNDLNSRIEEHSFEIGKLLYDFFEKELTHHA